MYNERVRFEFSEGVALSARLRLLAELAGQLEGGGRLSPTSPGFSVELGSKGMTTIDVWQPGKAEILVRELRKAEERGVLRVV